MRVSGATRQAGERASRADGRTSEAAWPFIECMEFASGDPAAADGCYPTTAYYTSIPASISGLSGEVVDVSRDH